MCAVLRLRETRAILGDELPWSYARMSVARFSVRSKAFVANVCRQHRSPRVPIGTQFSSQGAGRDQSLLFCWCKQNLVAFRTETVISGLFFCSGGV
jgi:hypothetical protein